MRMLRKFSLTNTDTWEWWENSHSRMQTHENTWESVRILIGSMRIYSDTLCTIWEFSPAQWEFSPAPWELMRMMRKFSYTDEDTWEWWENSHSRMRIHENELHVWDFVWGVPGKIKSGIIEDDLLILGRDRNNKKNDCCETIKNNICDIIYKINTFITNIHFTHRYLSDTVQLFSWWWWWWFGPIR